jgi:hypothetical protein
VPRKSAKEIWSDAIILSELTAIHETISTLFAEFHGTGMHHERLDESANPYLAGISESPSKRDKKEIS